MSIISSAYEAIETKLDSLFSATHKKINYPQVIENNDTLTLARGYGFYISFSSNTEKMVSCQLSLLREVNILLTIVNRGTHLDTNIRETAEKQLLEDQFTLIKALEKEPTVQDQLAYFKFSSDNGIEQVFDDKSNYLVIESTFLMEYFENLN